MSNWLLISQLAVFITIALVAGGVASYFLSPVSERTRMFAVTRAAKVLSIPEVIQLSATIEEGPLQKLASFLPRSKKDMDRLRSKLARAGVKSQDGPAIYTLIEYVAPVVVFALAVTLLGASNVGLVAGGVLGLVTFFAPGFWLDRTLTSRRRKIEAGLPDALDLLVVCIEAGSGVDQAIVKTGEEISIAYPSLGDELRVLTMEIRAGKSRLEAFKNLAQRTKSEDIRSLVAMLMQTDRFGTSVGQALRTHGDMLRTRRRQTAEEAAQKIGVKLVFPLVFCFFPAFYVVVLGPAVIQFMRAFMSL